MKNVVALVKILNGFFLCVKGLANKYKLVLNQYIKTTKLSQRKTFIQTTISWHLRRSRGDRFESHCPAIQGINEDDHDDNE